MMCDVWVTVCQMNIWWWWTTQHTICTWTGWRIS